MAEEEKVWMRHGNGILRFRCRDDKLNVAEICKKFKLDPESLLIGPDAIEVGNDGLSVDSIASIRQAGIEVGAGDGRSKDTPFILEQSLSASAQDDEQYKIRASAQDDEQHQKLISSTRDELRDSLEALPDLVSLPDFFRKSLPQNARFPVSESFYNRLPLQNRSEIFKPVSGSSPSLGDMPVIDMVHAILRDVDAQGREDTFHYVYDSLIKSPLQFLYGKPLVYRRNSTSDSSLRAYRPDAIYLFGGYVLFKGDEHTSGDPAEELLDKDAWPYGDSVPYIPAYYTRACSVNVCVLYQEQGQTRRRDLLRLDISKAEGRLDLVIACVRIAQLVQKLEQICELSGALPYMRMERAKGKILEFYGRRVVVTYSGEEALRVCYMHDLFKGCPFIPKTLHVNSEKGHIVFERGTEMKPRTRGELLECIVCVLKALVWLHGRNLMHRDLRWSNVVKGGDTEWWLVDFDEAGMSPSDGVVHLEPATHAPEIVGKHDCKVDIWGVGHLVSTYSAPTLLTAPLQDLARSCLATDPSMRPTAAECLTFIEGN